MTKLQKVDNLFFTGVSTALITPFKKGKIDFKSLKKLLRFQLDGEIKGFVVCGSTGETATLILEEKDKLIDFVLSEVAGQVPIIMGTGTNNTQESYELTKRFSKKKLQGFLLVTPYYNKPPQRGLIEHFAKVAKASSKPMIVYNVPSRTVIRLEVETVKELSKIKNIVGIKEAAGDLEIISQLVERLPKNFSILSGDDETFVPAMERGAHGVISVVSHIIPKLCVNARSGDQEKIRAISKEIFVESNPIPVKWALKQMGVIESDELRLPLVPLDKPLQSNLKNKMKEMGIL